MNSTDLHFLNSSVLRQNSQKTVSKRTKHQVINSNVQLDIVAKDRACADNVKQEIKTKLDMIFNVEIIKSDVIKYLSEEEKQQLETLHSPLLIG